MGVIEEASWRVASLWRYPVKSMQGESRGEVHLDANGVVGDRQYGVLDLEHGTVLSAKREGRLLDAAAILHDGELIVTLPDGVARTVGDELNDALSEWLARPVRLVEASAFGAATYESPEDFEDDGSPIETWEGPQGSFVDDSPLHLLTSCDLEQLASERPDLQWDARRFRPNALLEPIVDDPVPLAIGSRVELGDCEVGVHKGCLRCVMTTRAQPGVLDRELDILRHVARVHDGVVGVRAAVVRPGAVRLGDLVKVLS